MKSVDPPSTYKASLHSKPHCLRLSSAATPTKASEFRKQSSQSFMPAAKAVPLHEMSASVRACRTQSSTTFQPSRNLSRKERTAVPNCQQPAVRSQSLAPSPGARLGANNDGSSSSQSGLMSKAVRRVFSSALVFSAGCDYMQVAACRPLFLNLLLQTLQPQPQLVSKLQLPNHLVNASTVTPITGFTHGLD